MSNMSYCRFQNTVQDLRDCYDNMDDNDLSDEERIARRRLVKLCRNIVDDYMGDDGQMYFDDETPAPAGNPPAEAGNP